MRFDILTLFPESVDRFLNESIIGRAREKGILDIRTINIRDFSKDKHRKTDDYPYGGGAGMVMTPQPIYDAWRSVVDEVGYRPRTIYMSPQGRLFNQSIARELKEEKHLIILCGHYEGVDERVLEEIVDDEISIGDYVLTGGELPAMVLVDCVSRLVDGVLSSEESFSRESHYDGLLEYPQYTRPPEFMGRKVPEILLTGHHANIEKWRFLQMLERTKARRPDLYARYEEQNREKVLEAYGLLPKKRRRKKTNGESHGEQGTSSVQDGTQNPG
ncbi:MAG TPA: tRNA (guanosine(37)-N1)-methyltransferase TrmD [Thermoclostridium caenicola]|uniref:tRNA (guanine-N(1)-)-methyltransferase n=1 Tax=Thermoclostridium caenicola TaxID=659425 RepID=A0A1M6G8H3_9FIRM|nr:tRNA (guanosine(37)-N1)-methyltransferase TrmD [Thermoclostridium caenicola]SHJ06231.1 tRNA (guanine37-N1)-methyltransferase [Thermoclostridium caenicola]HOK43378.1 tRNA (guanosine(37)-N1)-methyltransferase TrmD [Thermoclostridium caenicola]HOL84689.1 tRNA (guanosine(37)-N1)-methyltransferase TrmD [Thermoclostridium caenicola]HPO76618.1 tRNA (guanosine(37)-N1)-methyltransferase TrmD [Thermoclostridium caenicola]HPU22511.1 tRNA (guanosine(37)-N1)-methyltransferase TrmD [Thermoclostridium cae